MDEEFKTMIANFIQKQLTTNEQIVATLAEAGKRINELARRIEALEQRVNI